MDRWLIGFIVGVLSSPWLSLGWSNWLIPLLASVLCLVLVPLPPRVRPYSLRSSRTLIRASSHRVTTVFVLGVLCGMQWSLINAKDSLSWKIPESELRQTTTLSIRILSIVDDNYDRLRFDARVLPTKESAIQKPVKLRLQWYGHPEDIPKLGEQWKVDVRLRPVMGLQNQVGFNHQAHLHRHQVRATGAIQRGERLSVADWQHTPLAVLRQSIYEAMDSHRPWLQHADVLLALSIGQRHWLDARQWQVLQHTGVAHIMAISGLHLTMVFGVAVLVWKWWLGVGGILLGTFARMLHVKLTWQYNSLPIALGLAWLAALMYAALADFSVATVRALLLISLVLGLRYLNLHSSMFRVLLVAVACILVLDPLAFLDSGFWLSCVAVLAIFSWLWRLPRVPISTSSESGSNGRTLVQTWYLRGAQLWRFEVMLTLLLLPLTVVFFGGVAWVAPLTNMVVVPLFTIAVLPLTLSALPLLNLWPALGYALLAAANRVMDILWYGLLWLADDGFIAVVSSKVGWLALAIVLCWYAPVSVRTRCQWQCCIGISMAIILLVQPRLQAFDPRIWLHVLDVGQGSAAVVEHRGEALLIDTGPGYRGSHQGANIIVPFLQARQLKPVLMVLTHGHWDHIGAAEFLQGYYPDMVVVDTEGIGLPCEWGQPWAWQGLHLHFLAPMPMAVFQGVNNQSCVVQLRFADQALLLPGDIERLGEFRLARHYGQRLRSNVLLVPHHGSRTSSHHYLLDLVQPQWAIISSGYLNRFNMPHPQSIERLEQSGAQILNTATAGQISLLWYRNRWQVRTQRQDFAPFWFNQLE